MTAYLIRRLCHMMPTLAGVVLLVFFLFNAFGDDPAEGLGGLNATPEQIAAIRAARARPAGVGAAVDLRQTDRELRLRQEQDDE